MNGTKAQTDENVKESSTM